MTINLTRKQLYDSIWKNGVSKAAQELNTTANKLKAAAVSANIPLPTSSYWSNLYIGNAVTKADLPNPDDPSIITIPEKMPHYLSNTTTPKKSTTTPHPHHSNSIIDSPDKQSQNNFPNISLNHPENINDVFRHIKVQKTMPQKRNTLINDIIDQQKRRKSDIYDYSNNKEILHFHKRPDIEISPKALIVTNSLLKALTSAGAILKLVDNDIEISLEGALIRLHCHVPSKQVRLDGSYVKISDK